MSLCIPVYFSALQHFLKKKNKHLTYFLLWVLKKEWVFFNQIYTNEDLDVEIKQKLIWENITVFY